MGMKILLPNVAAATRVLLLSLSGDQLRDRIGTDRLEIFISSDDDQR